MPKYVSQSLNSNTNKWCVCYYPIKVWSLLCSKSIPISHSNEIMLQRVRDFINMLKEALIKDWCIQSWRKAVRFGTQGVVRKKLESFISAEADL